MSNELMLYLMTRADSAQTLAGVAGGMAIGGAMLCLLVYALAKSESIDLPTLIPAIKRLLIGGVAMLFLCVAIPTKNDFLFIYGGSALLEAAKSNRASNIGNKTLDAVEKWLEDAAGEKKP